jgi:hypothetical protein
MEERGTFVDASASKICVERNEAAQQCASFACCCPTPPHKRDPTTTTTTHKQNIDGA